MPYQSIISYEAHYAGDKPPSGRLTDAQFAQALASGAANYENWRSKILSARAAAIAKKVLSHTPQIAADAPQITAEVYRCLWTAAMKDSCKRLIWEWQIT
jgi:hypothetical protein